MIAFDSNHCNNRNKNLDMYSQRREEPITSSSVVILDLLQLLNRDTPHCSHSPNTKKNRKEKKTFW